MLAFLAFFEPPDYQSFHLGLFLGAKCCGVAFLFFGVSFKHSPPLAAVQNTSVITVCPTVASSMFLSCRLALSCLCLGHVHVSPQYMNRSVIPICIPCCWRGLSAGADKFWTAILMPVLIFSLSWVELYVGVHASWRCGDCLASLYIAHTKRKKGLCIDFLGDWILLDTDVLLELSIHN